MTEQNKQFLPILSNDAKWLITDYSQTNFFSYVWELMVNAIDTNICKNSDGGIYINIQFLLNWQKAQTIWLWEKIYTDAYFYPLKKRYPGKRRRTYHRTMVENHYFMVSFSKTNKFRVKLTWLSVLAFYFY